MPNLSVITCWSSNTGDLLGEYFPAVQGAEVVTVNNAASADTTQMLDQMHEQIGGRHLKNATNLGFAAGNNQGYAAAGGDIIVFLNSDIAGDARFLRAVASDVRDGALYGPSLGQKLVAGRWLPYIEGWCIAATRATWEKVGVFWDESGVPPEDITMPMFFPWDAAAYPGPYWEDNDLCLRALQAGLCLIQTAWPIAHKGGRTAGPIAVHGASYEANRRAFTDRVTAAIGGGETHPDTPTYARYMQHVFTQSDIQHHLPLLYSLARGNVVELGTRTGVSTAALLAGVEAHGGRVWSIDIDPNSAKVADGHPAWTFIQGDSRAADELMSKQIGSDVRFSLALVDTEHTTEQVMTELSRWAVYMQPGGTICVHDPETFPGVRRAVTDFCRARGWAVTFVLPCHGMAVIEVPK